MLLSPPYRATGGGSSRSSSAHRVAGGVLEKLEDLEVPPELPSGASFHSWRVSAAALPHSPLAAAAVSLALAACLQGTTPPAAVAETLPPLASTGFAVPFQVRARHLSCGHMRPTSDIRRHAVKAGETQRGGGGGALKPCSHHHAHV